MSGFRRIERWACAAYLALTWACDPPPPALATAQAPRDPVDVAVQTVEAGPIQRYVRATGTLFGEEETRVSAKVAGRIDAVYHDVGDAVSPGDALARVEPTDYALAVTERKRGFEQSLARIGLEALPGEDFAVDDLPAVQRAKLQSDNARAKYDRAEILHKRTPPAVSDQDFADLRTAWDVAQADQRLAVLNARAQLAEARALQAQLASAQQRLADTVHAAPHGERPPIAEVDGFTAPSVDYVVTQRDIAVGDYVQIGASLFELVDPDPLKLRVQIPEREAPRIHLGQRVTLEVEAYQRAFEGRVARINPAVEPRTRTFQVEILVHNSDRALRSGSFARAAIEVELDPHALLIPKGAVTTFAGVHKVFVVDGGKAVERVVSLGVEDGERVEVTSGLQAGEVIAREVVPALTGGVPVRAKAP